MITSDEKDKEDLDRSRKCTPLNLILLTLQFIEENNSNQSKLFRESKRLLNIQADKTLPPHTNAVKLANVHKITAIRSKLAASTQSPPSAAQESDYTTTLEMTDLSFSEFALLTEEDVKNLALACKVSEVSCLSRLAPTVTRVVIQRVSGLFARRTKKKEKLLVV